MESIGEFCVVPFVEILVVLFLLAPTRVRIPLHILPQRVEGGRLALLAFFMSQYSRERVGVSFHKDIAQVPQLLTKGVVLVVVVGVVLMNPMRNMRTDRAKIASLFEAFNGSPVLSCQVHMPGRESREHQSDDPRHDR
jgi:hypothetical protein